jgi:mRNA-degrading endonuclease RelE of RelBE toxin-antitoxin system
MSYSIVVPKSVQKQLDKLPEQLYQRILKKYGFWQTILAPMAP